MLRFTTTLLIATFLISGCASQYRKDGLLTGGGLKHEWIDNETLKVRARGNAYTSPEKTDEMRLLWAAERFEEKRISSFHIIDSDDKVVDIHSGGQNWSGAVASGLMFTGFFKAGVGPEESKSFITSQVIETLGPEYIK